jgi:acetylornithine/succinyldiaminopimelate/putrescine aminotransferase
MTEQVYRSVYDSVGHANVHASTFEGNLLAMSVGLEVIRIIERGHLLNRVFALGSEFERRLKQLQQQKIGILDVRVSGLLMGFKVADSVFKDEALWGAAGCR